jgi:hypothetical protein
MADLECGTTSQAGNIVSSTGPGEMRDERDDGPLFEQGFTAGDTKLCRSPATVTLQTATSCSETRHFATTLTLMLWTPDVHEPSRGTRPRSGHRRKDLNGQIHGHHQAWDAQTDRAQTGGTKTHVSALEAAIDDDPANPEDCDEFPYFSTPRGGPGAQIAPIPSGDDRKEGTPTVHTGSWCDAAKD